MSHEITASVIAAAFAKNQVMTAGKGKQIKAIKLQAALLDEGADYVKQVHESRSDRGTGTTVHIYRGYMEGSIGEKVYAKTGIRSTWPSTPVLASPWVVIFKWPIALPRRCLVVLCMHVQLADQCSYV